MPSAINNKSVVALLVASLILIFAGADASASDGVKLKTVVIDAGHGGNDPGAISLDGKLKEKDVVLDIALTLGSLIEENYSDVKVIYTRKKDVFIPLAERSNIANRNHADLFISIHCNSVPKNAKAPSGSETFVMGMHKNSANMAVCKAENAVILMEDDYSTTYQGYDPNNPESAIFFNLMQNANFEQSLIMADYCQKSLSQGPIKTNRGIKQGGLLVLWRTTMPSVLVELGFISNSADKGVFAAKAKRDQIASRLFTAFSNFKKQYETSLDKPVTTESAASEEPAPAAPAASAAPAEREEKPAPAAAVENPVSCYSIQIFSISRKLASSAPEFKGEKASAVKVGNIYKYYVGSYGSFDEAKQYLPSMRKKFPGAFVIKLENGAIVSH